ncbi:MAG: hypothetical protein CMO32_30310 [Variovorax sp.]|nr:hypothetical protein [Variovorax sp.]
MPLGAKAETRAGEIWVMAVRLGWRAGGGPGPEFTGAAAGPPVAVVRGAGRPDFLLGVMVLAHRIFSAIA